MAECCVAHQVWRRSGGVPTHGAVILQLITAQERTAILGQSMHCELHGNAGAAQPDPAGWDPLPGQAKKLRLLASSRWLCLQYPVYSS
jgi:hypothetical protein